MSEKRGKSQAGDGRDERRGIHDPWRLYSPDREQSPDETPTGTPGSTHPLDADLLPHQEYVFRHPRASGDLLIYGADTAPGAALLLMAVIANLPAFLEVLKEEGFVWGREKEVPAKGFVIQTEHHRLSLPDAKNTADGLGRLVVSIRRCPKDLQKTLEKAGVIPLIK